MIVIENLAHRRSLLRYSLVFNTFSANSLLSDCTLGGDFIRHVKLLIYCNVLKIYSANLAFLTAMVLDCFYY